MTDSFLKYMFNAFFEHKSFTEHEQLSAGKENMFFR